MNRKWLLYAVAALFVAALAGAALAHTPLFSCWDNGDGTLSCEGGFSDGSSAANMPIRVTNEKDEVIFEGKLDEGGELTFKKPEGENGTVNIMGIAREAGNRTKIAVYSDNEKLDTRSLHRSARYENRSHFRRFGL